MTYNAADHLVTHSHVVSSVLFQWLVDFVSTQKQRTFMIVSHDTVFLDKVVTDVIHYEGRRLVYYHGNLSHFVQLHPEAKFYFELDKSTLNFKFPTPDRLDGINSTTRFVLVNAYIYEFTYT